MAAAAPVETAMPKILLTCRPPPVIFYIYVSAEEAHFCFWSAFILTNKAILREMWGFENKELDLF